MKAYLEQLLIPEDALFLIKQHQVPAFNTPHHFHREMELKIMLQGSGKGFIGDAIYEYDAGDMVLVGPNLPHHWESADHYERKGLYAECIYIQFKEDFIGSEIFDKSDFASVRNLFQQARQGVQFGQQTFNECIPIITQLPKASGTRRIVLFIELLATLSHSYSYKLLSNQSFFAESNSTQQNDRLHRIYQYIQRNYKSDIQLDTACKLVSMSKTAFCVYFKKRTQKSFIDFVNEVRLHHVIRLVRDHEMSISEACYQSGFNNISFFNRKFKAHFKTTPRNYFKQA